MEQQQKISRLLSQPVRYLVDASQGAALENSKRYGPGLRKPPGRADREKKSSTIAMLREDILECM
jgi:hypothetical protein